MAKYCSHTNSVVLTVSGRRDWVGFVSGSVVEKLKQIGRAKGLAVEKLEGGFIPRIVNQSSTRIRRTAKKRIAVVAKPQAQYEVATKVNFVLAVDGKYR